ncbi:MAG TPA: hypothetical protein VIT45_03875 [Allosphingosinicella sp.]
MSLAACTSVPPEDRSLRIEDRPAEGVIRISNPSRMTARVYYNYEPGFGDHQMLFFRFRDAERRIIKREYDGWFTPLEVTSNLSGPGEYPPRKQLVIRPRGYIDLRRDVGAMTKWFFMNEEVTGPCEMQLKLSVFSERWTNRRLETEGAWQPAPCPKSYVPPSAPPATKGTR